MCVDVEDETALRRQVLTDTEKHSLPVGEAPNVIDRVEDTANRVEAVADLKIDHILPEELCLRHFLTSYREHAAGCIEPGYFVVGLQILQYRSGSASELEYVCGMRIGFQNELSKVLGWSGSISHHLVVEFPEDLVSRHVVQFNQSSQPNLSECRALQMKGQRWRARTRVMSSGCSWPPIQLRRA